MAVLFAPASPTVHAPNVRRNHTAARSAAGLISESTIAALLPSSPDDFAGAQVTVTDMNLLADGAPTSPAPRPPRPATGLRLPSFELLGIAAPHPDRFGSLAFHDYDPAMPAALDGHHAGGHAMLPDMESLKIESPLAASPSKPKLPPGLVQTPFRHDVATLTPPAEAAEPAWHPAILAHLSDSSMGSRPVEPCSLTSTPVRLAGERPVVVAAGGETAPESSESLHPASHSQSHSPADTDSTWIDGAVSVLVSNVRSALLPNNPLRVLSHALPAPSTGHTYTKIIERIGAVTPSNPPTWINVFHAIPGKFNLPDIPTSPPSTPGLNAEEDYFTQKVFASAVPISDYQDDLSALPRSPRPIVPPSTVNLAIVERYIPPTSVNEFKEMFSPNGPSLLVDRLVELSPAGGSLVFIYPTKAGATTFMREYLGPILDPLLRSTQVVNGISANLSQDLGTMAAAKQLQEFEQMRQSVETLCARLAQRGRGRFAPIYASKAQVKIERTAWAKDWWPKQEYPRIKETVTRATQEAQKKQSNRYMERASTPTELVSRLIEGVQKNRYPVGQEPSSGIEVSIFVIQRSA
ncbi:hypothetical protein CBER1_07215 [Cercospora berteroae]|uniref:Uncharacterized protein n=1 Tax=Cercospora berteroae TaxID=357750 RepID=A0A2S6CM87_9PEZI|nr:hypothetical protein CBER1_07215 [Cercospora berteroae]